MVIMVYRMLAQVSAGYTREKFATIGTIFVLFRYMRNVSLNFYILSLDIFFFVVHNMGTVLSYV
jgi:hypothetical protein